MEKTCLWIWNKMITTVDCKLISTQLHRQLFPVFKDVLHYDFGYFMFILFYHAWCADAVTHTTYLPIFSPDLRSLFSYYVILFIIFQNVQIKTLSDIILRWVRCELEENLEEVVDPYMLLILHFLGVAEEKYREAQTQRWIFKQRFIPE
jgi:hypothetical protein